MISFMAPSSGGYVGGRVFQRTRRAKKCPKLVIEVTKCEGKLVYDSCIYVRGIATDVHACIHACVSLHDYGL